VVKVWPAAGLVVCIGLGAAEVSATSFTLAECIDQALKANRTHAVSRASQKVAEAQYQQALSARWPEASLDLTGMRRDQDPNFIFPSNTFSLGTMAAPIAEAVAATQLAKAGVTPGSVGLATYNAQLAAATQSTLSQFPGITTPSQDVKLFDRDTLTSSFNVHIPLYTGGKISALIQQGKAGVDAAREEVHRTDLQIVQETRNYYFGAVLASQLRTLGEESLERLKVMQDLTASLYQNGSGKVKKTDYLRSQVVVASLKSLVALLRSNEELARAALANTMGLPWRTSVTPADLEIPTLDYGGALEDWVAKAQSLNPQALQVGYGLSAAEAGVDKAKAGHLPVVVLFGSVDRLDNSYHQGLITDQNRNSWTLGLRVQVPIFNGFRVQNEIREAQARKEKLGLERQILLEGLGLQVKNAFLEIARAIQQTKATSESLAVARENRELHERAFQEELVETKDVIEAQLTELFIRSQHQKARYDAQIYQSQLDNLIGQTLSETH
jgi:outer membrane protein TolC